MASTTELKNLTPDEEDAFRLVNEGKYDEVIRLIDSSKVRVNCLDSTGMNLLDQASHKGDVNFVQQLIERGANVDNKAQNDGFTCLMFAALRGNPHLCDLLLTHGARAHAVTKMNKTATEMAALVNNHECVSIINSYISREEVDVILHPQGKQSSEIYPESLVDLLHLLTRRHLIHPILIAIELYKRPECIDYRKKMIYVVDMLFERQMRTKEPNEILAMKLWFVLTGLRKIEEFVKVKQQEKDLRNLMRGYIRALSAWKEVDNVIRRSFLERFLFSTSLGFPYQHSLIFKALGRALKEVKPGRFPNVFTVICSVLFGQRFVVTSGFCSLCGKPKSEFECSKCTVSPV
uniref:ANK_REP_REGION domain-containing protein n=1 Tax=Bursaphelenchus xylophilus TaxID=6326 RepID=A0A1I7SF77_BURXY